MALRACGGHINLVETFAERIAENVLSDKRIIAVRVMLEKLERGPLRGVEIIRPRRGKRHASSAVVEKPAGGVSPLVVKVGGSLAETGRMYAVVSMIAAARVPVVVPGGGPFADSIRALQPTMKFGEAMAHRLAMLAMQQMGELIVAQSDRFIVAQSLGEISNAVRNGKVPVWAPLRMIAGDAAVPAGWSATSDSLAARLAELLGAPLVPFSKSVDVTPDATLEDLARRGIVDPILPSIVARGELSWSIFGPSAAAPLRAILHGEGER